VIKSAALPGMIVLHVTVLIRAHLLSLRYFPSPLPVFDPSQTQSMIQTVQALGICPTVWHLSEGESLTLLQDALSLHCFGNVTPLPERLVNPFSAYVMLLSLLFHGVTVSVEMCKEAPHRCLFYSSTDSSVDMTRLHVDSKVDESSA
jgi:hypothetical protein